MVSGRAAWLLLTVGILCGGPVAEVVTGRAVAAEVATGPSGLPLPRFVSLKSDHVNVRVGPHKDNEVRWVYTRSRLPVEITAEFENWRRVRDSEGSEGWVYHSLLSGRRTAVVNMKVKTELASLYHRADAASAVVARLQEGVITQVKSCEVGWCQVSGRGFEGFIEQERLWGVYINEKFD